MSVLNTHPVVITTFDHRRDVSSILSRSFLKADFNDKEDIIQLPFPYSYTDEGVSKEVIGHAVKVIADDLKNTDHAVILDVPSLLNVVKVLKQEVFSLGIQDEITEGRVLCLTYDENNVDSSQPAFTLDIEEGIRITENLMDKRDIAFITLKDPEGGSGYLVDFIFNIQDRNALIRETGKKETQTSEWGLVFPDLSNESKQTELEIIIPSFEDIIEVNIEDVWSRICGLSSRGKIVYVDKKILKEKQELTITLPKKIKSRVEFI